MIRTEDNSGDKLVEINLLKVLINQLIILSTNMNIG